MQSGLLFLFISGVLATKEVQKYLKDINYDANKRPNNNGLPDNISVQFGLHSLRDIDYKSFTFKIRTGVNLRWQDKRLENVTFSMLGEPSQLIWVPSFGIYNAIGTRPSSITKQTWINNVGVGDNRDYAQIWVVPIFLLRLYSN